MRPGNEPWSPPAMSFGCARAAARRTAGSAAPATLDAGAAAETTAATLQRVSLANADQRPSQQPKQSTSRANQLAGQVQHGQGATTKQNESTNEREQCAGGANGGLSSGFSYSRTGGCGGQSGGASANQFSRESSSQLPEQLAADQEPPGRLPSGRVEGRAEPSKPPAGRGGVELKVRQSGAEQQLVGHFSSSAERAVKNFAEAERPHQVAATASSAAAAAPAAWDELAANSARPCHSRNRASETQIKPSASTTTTIDGASETLSSRQQATTTTRSRREHHALSLAPVAGPPQDAECNHQDCDPGFWAKLSNLSRSIIQQQHLLAHSASTQSRRHWTPDNQAAGGGDSTQLAPEVLGYLAERKLRPCGSSTSSGTPQDHPATMTKTGGVLATQACRDSPESQQQQQQMLAAGPPDELAKLRRLHDDEAARDLQQEPGQTFAAMRKKRPATAENMDQQQRRQQQQTGDELEMGQQNAGAATNQNQAAKQKQPQQVKLSITTNATNTTTTTSGSPSDAASTSSSASSLDSCILSESNSAESDELRLKWGKKMDFLLSIIGFAVDLANIWRFPYLVYKNGGGVFLIPYLTMLIFGGIPLFFLELCLGQYVKKGPITVWNKICPYMKGVGYCSILISWYVSFYYNVLIAWSVYFIYRSILSFGDKMPWEDCDNPWNSPTTCVSISKLKDLCSLRTNETLEACRKEMFSTINVTSPASDFFVKELSQIDQSSGLDDMGYLRPELVVCTMIVYLLHYFTLFRGLETSGKVVWVTATAPYMILSILLVRGLFLPGASMGIEYYLKPRMDKLADPQVWIDAAGQVFYSIGVGFGVHLTYASFNSHNNNCYRDCLMTSAVNALTSVYSGLVVFVYLGYMAANLGIEIDKVASEGYSLVFEVYPEALTTLPFARFWSILFFIMLLTLGIDSAMGGLEAVITGLEDEFRFAKRLSRGQLTALVIVSSFLPALISCTQGGAYTLFWFDIYSAGVSLLFSALFETIGVVYCYGLDKFILNIESMLGRRPQLFYILCWKYISPIFLMGIIFMSIYTASVPVYRGYTFPLWSIILGWCLAFSSVAAVPVVAVYTLCFKSGVKAVSMSPSKSPRKQANAAAAAGALGAASVTSGGGKSASRKSTPSQGHHCSKSMSVVSYNGGANQSQLGGGCEQRGVLVGLQPDQHQHFQYLAGSGTKEEML